MQHRIMSDMVGNKVALIPDPGNAGTIDISQNGVCLLTSTGVETRTLPAPSTVGQMLTLCMDVDGGDITVTASAVVNQTGNNTITFGAVADAIFLISVQVSGSLRWFAVGNDGAALSTV